MSQFTPAKMAEGMRLAKKSAARRRRLLDAECDAHREKVQKRARRDAQKELDKPKTVPRHKKPAWTWTAADKAAERAVSFAREKARENKLIAEEKAADAALDKALDHDFGWSTGTDEPASASGSAGLLTREATRESGWARSSGSRSTGKTYPAVPEYPWSTGSANEVLTTTGQQCPWAALAARQKYQSLPPSGA